MSLRDQNDLQIVAELKPLRSQDDLVFDFTEGKVVIISPENGQTDFDGSYEWNFSGLQQWFRVEVATDSEFANIVQQEDVQAKQLLSTIADGTGYNIRVTALRVIGAVSPEVTGVSLNTTANEVPKGNTLVILGSVQGENNYNTAGTWTRESGDAIAFTVSGNEIDITGGTEGNSATFRFTADGDNSFFVDRTVTVTASVSAGTDNSRAGDEESLRLHAESLGVANWYDNTGWSASSMSLDNTIYGVTTATIGGELRVTEIDLMANNLIGELPEFPGFQECTRMRFKQMEAGMDSRNPPVRISGRIPDSIGDNTKVSELSLSGRKDNNGDPSDVWNLADDDPGTGYNKKFGIPPNQFTNGIPDSLYTLKLKKLELDGQSSQFGATLKEDCSNWDGMTHFYATGNAHYTEGESAFFGAMPSGTNTWTNCLQFRFFDNQGVTSFELDMFDGWNDIVRDITVSGDPNVSQPLPSFSGLTKLRFFKFGDIQWSGEYPRYINTFEAIQAMDFDGHRFNDSRDLNFQDSPVSQRLGLQISSADPANLTGRFFTGAEKSRRMILFSLQGNQGLRDCMTEGVEKWSLLRFYRIQFTGGSTGSTLSSKPPGQYSCSLRFLSLPQAKLQGSLTSEWKFAGSLKDRGGVVYDNGTITGFPNDGEIVDGFTDHYIDDSGANYDTDELVGMVLNQVNSASGTKRRVVESNTATRIFYSGWTVNDERPLDNLEVGQDYIIERNFNTDNRAFENGIFLFDNFLTGEVPTDVAPLYLVNGSFSLRLNLFQMKDIAPAVANIEKKSRMNWCIRDPREDDVTPGSSGDITFTFNGNSSVITLDGSQTGDQQAQAIATAITNDTGIELTCEYEQDAQTLVFDHNLTGITNALKDITYDDTDGTGFSFQYTGYSFSYAPQGRLVSEDRRYSIPSGYTVPTYFQDQLNIVTAGSNPTIDFSDQAYTGNTYQWRKRGVGETTYSDISGETSDTLTITDFQSADQGDYILEIENPAAPDLSGADIMRSGVITLTL